MNLDLPDIYNAASTFVDGNIARGRGGKVAIYYQDREITYQEVFESVNRVGNALRSIGIEIEHRSLAPLTFASHAYPEFHLLMPLYLCKQWEGTVAPREGQAIAWVRPDALDAYHMPPADEPLKIALRGAVGREGE